MTTKIFSGVIPALLTPFNQRDEVDYSALEMHITRLIEQGIDGLFVCGTTGLWWLLSDEERMNIVEKTMKICSDKIPIMVHVGTMSTRSSIRLAEHAEGCGAQAISALPPVGFSYPPDSVWEYFKDIAESCGLPLYLYHLPQLFGNLITMDKFIEALDVIPSLEGVKFSAYQIDHLIELKVKSADSLKGALNILSGGAEQLLSAVSCGAAGSVCSWYNLFPRLARKIIDCIHAGDVQKAQAHQDLLIRAIIDIRNMGHGMLWRLVTERGINVGQPRKPLPHLSEKVFESKLPQIKKSGILDWSI